MLVPWPTWRATILKTAFCTMAAAVAGSTLAAGTAAAGTVRVANGETLSEIASHYHTTVAALAAANDITNPNLVYAAAVLQLPASGSAGTVRVANGETLSEIASHYHTTVAALAAANGITNPNLVYSGAVLQLPDAGPSSTGGAQSTTTTVGQGETLFAIASQYQTTVPALAAANGITNPNLVYAGSELRLPGQSMALVSYAVPASGSSGGLPAQLLAHPERLALRADFTRSANSYGVPASLLEALCWWESGWQETVVSTTGAIGVCQIEPATASFVTTVLFPGSGLDAYSAAGNIAIGAAYLHDLLVRAGDSESTAIAGYYQGLESVDQSGMLPATRTYVTGILAYASIFASSG
jgi:N-acetylmuramoyl-L-alanine amidase